MIHVFCNNHEYSQELLSHQNRMLKRKKKIFFPISVSFFLINYLLFLFSNKKIKGRAHRKGLIIVDTLTITIYIKSFLKVIVRPKNDH